MFELTGPERQTITIQAAKSAAAFLKAVKNPEADLFVVEARGALERFTLEVESATSRVQSCKIAVTVARDRLHADVAGGKGSEKAWAGVTEAERASVEAGLRLETARGTRADAQTRLAAARLAAIEGALPAAGEAANAAREAARAAEVSFMAGARALAMVRSRVGSLASQADHLRTAAAGGAT